MIAHSSKYVGEFKNWRFNGRGTLILKNGEKKVGNFIDGLLIE